MKRLVQICLSLALLLLALNAHVHQSVSGISCAPWPDCYALVGAAGTGPAPWLLNAQGIITGLCGLASLFLVLVAIRDGRHRVLALAILGLVVALASLELQARTYHHPGLTTGLILAGFALLAALAWLMFRLSPGAARYTETRIRHVRPAVTTALVLLSLQIILGALNSANYTARSCLSLASCEGAWIPDATTYAALRVDRPYVISGDGHAMGDFERKSIQLLHRWTAASSVIAIAFAALAGLTATDTVRRLGVAALSLAVIESSIGVAAAMTGIPAWLALAHSLFAAVLLLILLKMHALSKERWWHDYSNLPDKTTPDWDRIVSSRSSR